MKVYFSPLACSLATRICLYEARAVDAVFVEVDPKSKRTEAGLDLRTKSPLGLVPTVELPNGEVLTENSAILQAVAALHPDAALVPDSMRVQEALSFVSTELHKLVFAPLLDERAPAEVKAYARTKAEPRLDEIGRRVDGGRWVTGPAFSVADAYLFAVLNWTAVTGIDLATRPSLAAFRARMLERSAVKRAFDEERALYARERERHAAGRTW